MSNKDFIDLIQDVHGVYIQEQELEELQIELYRKAQESRIVLADNVITYDIDADLGKIFFVVVGAVLGGFLLPGLGIASGFLQGALLGAAIGYRLAGLFDTTPQRKNITANPTFAFS